MSIYGVNNLGLYGYNQVQPAGIPGMQQNYGIVDNSSMFGSLFGTGQQQSDPFAVIAPQANAVDPQLLRKAIDINGDGQITQEEITAFLSNPTAAIQKATAISQQGGSNQLLQMLLPILMSLMNGQSKNTEAISKNNAATAQNNSATAQLQQQLLSAVANSDKLKQQVTDQGKKLDESQTAITKAQSDLKAAIAKSEETATALEDFKNGPGKEDPKRFANEFAQLLNANKDAAVSRNEFKALYKAAGEDAVIDKTEWDSLIKDSKLADDVKADLTAQVAESEEIDVKKLEEQFFEADKDEDGKVEAGAEINAFGTDVAENDGDATSVETGDLSAESFEV
ncbi:MAG: hypothetical protein A2039_03615 [Candidatus Melainabacteria bacterium GWA2_34_9]|nr:MAG: hypothetical protein A2039_03615 [Candidatus Melainabacteria bacterium GWA2_34_9]